MTTIESSTKPCTRCSRALALDQFPPAHRRGKVYVGSWCYACTSEVQKAIVADPARRRANARNSAARYPDRRRARELVKSAVRRGDLPRAKNCACVDCGKPAAAYDHHLGYAPEHTLAVEPVCHPCHGLRARQRRELRRFS